MAEDNRPIKYMRYAIGEIVLVVIGILIALSINNWNEERKNKITENIYLENIKADLRLNLTSLETYIADRKNTVNSVENILVFFNDERPLDINEFNLYSLNIMDWEPFQHHDNTYQELINSGKFSIISNKAIKDDLQNIQTILKNIHFVESEMQQDYERYLYEPFFSTIDLDNSIKNVNAQRTNSKNLPKLELVNVQLLLKNKMFKNGFVLADYNSNDLIRTYTKMKEATNELILLIDKELEQ